MVGANVSMLASTLLLNGVDRLRRIREDLSYWLEARECESIGQLRGSMSQQHVAEPAAFERAHYVRTVGTFGRVHSLPNAFGVDVSNDPFD